MTTVYRCAQCGDTVALWVDGWHHLHGADVDYDHLAVLDDLTPTVRNTPTNKEQ